MVDGRLSSAVVTCVWGHPRRSWPARDFEAVIHGFGDEAAELSARIEAIFELVDGAEVDWSAEDLPNATGRIAAIVRGAHAELSDEAIRAIGSQFSYSWR